MNIDHPEEERRASIIPSARPPIHNTGEGMGRYGINKPSDANKTFPPAHTRGIDEVDNILSKPVRHTSPLNNRAKKLLRTNSCPTEEEETGDDSNVLSKSLPSTLPYHLHSSDYFDEELNRLDRWKHERSNQDRMDLSGQSASSFQILERSEREDETNWTNYSFDQQQTSFNKQQPKRQTESNKSLLYVIFPLVFVIMAVLLYFYVDDNSFTKSLQFSSYSKSTQTVNYEKIFESSMKNLQKKYNIDSDSILKLKSGISTISSRMDTGSFIFVYNSNTNDFDLSQFDKFINEVASTTAKYLRNDTSSVEHTVIKSYLDMKEHEELIDRYRDAVGKTGVLLVKEVDGVPSDLAMAFHYYCDEYDPLVKRSAIFFTLNLANCSHSDEKSSTHNFIEKCLAGKWKTVPQENMRPLLTRLVNVIIDVTSAF